MLRDYRAVQQLQLEGNPKSLVAQCQWRHMCRSSLMDRIYRDRVLVHIVTIVHAALHRTWRFVVVFTAFRHRFVPWEYQYTFVCIPYLCNITIIQPLTSWSPKWCFPFRYIDYIFLSTDVFLISTIRATFQAHSIIVDLITLIISVN